jgi:hypothetical protein
LEELMKLKLIVLSALFAAGVFASLALADGGKHGRKADSCRKVHLFGTIAPQTLAVTVDRTNRKSVVPAGTVVNLALGESGQAIRVAVEACASGADGALVYSVRGLQLRVKPARAATTETSTTAKTTAETEHGGRGHGKRDGHPKRATATATTTTSSATTTAATTTGTTTTTP